jgi:hypothetical protein
MVLSMEVQRGALRMQVNWSRGFFRAWLALAAAWVISTGCYEYVSKPWNQFSDTGPSTDGECWDRLAKWPDGQSFDWWDIDIEADTPSNIEINKKKGAWQAAAIPERNKWSATVTQRLVDCEAATPILQKASRQLTRIWSSEKDDLAIIIGLPIALLFVGLIIAWVVRGFRQTTKSPCSRPTPLLLRGFGIVSGA